MSVIYLMCLGFATAFAVAIALYFNRIAVKFLALAMMMITANAIYFSLDYVKGWPTENTEYAKGTLASVVIVNPTANDEGGIYVGIFIDQPEHWMIYKYPRYAPKTFYVKYSNDRAAKFEQAKEAMEEGREVRINGIPAENSGSSGTEEGTGDESSIIGTVQEMIERMLPQAGDTYKPEAPEDIQIMEPSVPPQKGTTK